MLEGEVTLLQRTVEPCEVAIASPLEESVLDLLERPRTLLSLRLAARAGELDLLEVMARLHDLGAVRFVAESEPDSDTAAWAVPAHLSGRASSRNDETLAISSGPDVALGAAPDPQAEESTVAVGVLDLATPAAALRISARELLAEARRKMEQKCYDEALELFRWAERSDPTDARLTMLRAGAEGVCAEVFYRGELRKDARPLRVPDSEAVRDVGPLAQFLLERTDGGRTVGELVALSGAPEIDALFALRDLKRRGLVDLGRG